MYVHDPRHGKHHIDVEGYRGFDVILPYLPACLRRRIVARKVWVHFGSPQVLTEKDITFAIHGDPRVYELTGPLGRHREVVR